MKVEGKKGNLIDRPIATSTITVHPHTHAHTRTQMCGEHTHTHTHTHTRTHARTHARTRALTQTNQTKSSFKQYSDERNSDIRKRYCRSREDFLISEFYWACTYPIVLARIIWYCSTSTICLHVAYLGGHTAQSRVLYILFLHIPVSYTHLRAHET